MPPTEEARKEFMESLTLEKPKGYASGPDTSFAEPTPMPRRFMEDSLGEHNSRFTTQKQQHPCFETASSDIGKLPITEADMPLRWYGLEGKFTTQFYLGGARPGQKANSALSTAMDRSSIHHSFDQGWSGKAGLRDHNIGSLKTARTMLRRE